MDIALEIGERGEELCFPQNALLASYGNSPALVECDGTEVAVSEAPSVVGDGELHFLYSGNAALCLVNGVIGAHIGQLINMVKLGSGEGQGRGELNQHFRGLALDNGLAVNLVLPVVLYFARLGVFFLIFPAQRQ